MLSRLLAIGGIGGMASGAVAGAGALQDWAAKRLARIL
jgi:hypothetical protein